MTSYAQSFTLKGLLKDTNLQLPLYRGSVVLLQARDSFIVADTRADKQGRFVFNHLSDTASYILFFSYPGYAAYSHRITTEKPVDGVLDMGTVGLLLKEKLLREVIIKSQTAIIKIKGDTTEFTADSFKVQANASVEDLLKQLPGLQVDQYGNITVQGQKVRKVLVDGEEFFGDDPTLVTRNLRADMVDKVQVYDKKSDAAVFTGIDDGVKDKTINLKIKQDKNHGVFGKVELGGGTDEHYNAQGMLNAFKGKRRMSLYGTNGNIGRTGLGAADRQKIGTDNDGTENYNDKGIPTVTSAGAHYDNKWNNDQQSFNGNYKFNTMTVNGEDIVVSQNNLPTGLILGNSNNRFDNRNTRQSANGKYIFKVDTSATITAYADGTVTDDKTASYGNTQNFRGDSSMIYNNESNDRNDYHLRSYNVNLAWEKRLKKAGRTISLYLNNNFSNDHSSGENLSRSDYYDSTGRQDSTALLYLGRRTNDDWRTNTLKAIYTAPISGKLSLILNYQVENKLNHDDKRSYNLVENPAGKNEDAAFSSKMNSNIWTNQGGIAINYAGPKLVLKAGNNIRTITMDLESELDNYRLKRNFLNWNPGASMQYTVKQYSVLQLNYTGNSINPERTQLLPLKFSNGQLVTYLANPDLDNSFSHKISGDYNTAKVVSNVYTGGNGSVTFTTNPIAQAINVTAAGKYIYRFVNMPGYTNMNYDLMAYYGRQLPFNIQMIGALNTSGGRSFNLTDDKVNKLTYSTYGAGLEMYKSQQKKYNTYLLVKAGYNINKSSLQPGSENNFPFIEIRPSLAIYFLKKFEIHTDANYLWQRKSQAFSDNFSRVIWNAWLGRTFLKQDQLTIRISCNDILNQNNGYSRTANNNFFSENRYTTIRRFFMLGATWNFTRFRTIKQ
ncbi:outer membrane beta-barrel protein [Chitinophaga sp. YR627]|uniref:outer membrane beta-barrel protein n=1 Tax=Chitinophaga sp. YR627 TaxID=1881041 RepID=UPI0021013430|nr:outer membrane beta-barrel protein [Chitinophaga sp. YR627]